MARMDDNSEHNQLVNIARLYYIRKMTHQRIASKLGLSRVKATRLLKEAVDKEIVQFKIQGPIGQTFELEEHLEHKLGLSRAIVVPAVDSEAEIYNALGAHGADYLLKELRGNMTIGLCWGRTLNAMMAHLKPSTKKHLNVVSFTGGLAANSRQPNPYDITSAVVERLGATPHYLVVPAIVESAQVRDPVLQEPSAQKVIRWWNKIDMCMMSIGIISKHTGAFYSLEDPALQVKRTKQMGGVGDMVARPFNIDGEFLRTEFSERTITIDTERLRKIPHLIGIAGGRQKARSILGALRTGVINVLITDETCARKILELAGGTGNCQ